MKGVGGEGERGDAVVGEVVAGDGVGALVFGVHGFVDVEGVWGGEVLVEGWCGVGAVCGGGGACFRGEDGVVAFFVVDDECAVHVGG